MAVRTDKATINATVSPILKKQAEELVKIGDYSSVSDIIEAALTLFFHIREEKEKAKKVVIE